MHDRGNSGSFPPAHYWRAPLISVLQAAHLRPTEWHPASGKQARERGERGRWFAITVEDVSLVSQQQPSQPYRSNSPGRCMPVSETIVHPGSAGDKIKVTSSPSTAREIRISMVG